MKTNQRIRTLKFYPQLSQIQKKSNIKIRKMLSIKISYYFQLLVNYPWIQMTTNIYLIMPVINQENFQKQKQSICEAELEFITTGVNRLNFINQRITHKSNFIARMLLSQRLIQRPHSTTVNTSVCTKTYKNKNIITNTDPYTDTEIGLDADRKIQNNFITSFPKSEHNYSLRTKSSFGKQQYITKPELIKLRIKTVQSQRKQAKLLEEKIRKTKEEQQNRKRFMYRRQKKQNQQRKLKIQKMRSIKNEEIKQYKAVMKENNLLLLDKKQRYIQKYEERVAMGEKMKDFIVQKLKQKKQIQKFPNKNSQIISNQSNITINDDKSRLVQQNLCLKGQKFLHEEFI